MNSFSKSDDPKFTKMIRRDLVLLMIISTITAMIMVIPAYVLTYIKFFERLDSVSPYKVMNTLIVVGVISIVSFIVWKVNKRRYEKSK